MCSLDASVEKKVAIGRQVKGEGEPLVSNTLSVKYQLHKVINGRGQKQLYFLYRDCAQISEAKKNRLVRQVEWSCPASACSFSTPRLNPVFTHGLLSLLATFRDCSQLYTSNRHRVSSEFLRAFYDVPVASFSNKNPPAQGQLSELIT